MSSLGTELKINVHLDRLDGYRMSYVKKTNGGEISPEEGGAIIYRKQ